MEYSHCLSFEDSSGYDSVLEALFLNVHQAIWGQHLFLSSMLHMVVLHLSPQNYAKDFTSISLFNSNGTAR